jgi:hypothetical protein
MPARWTEPGDGTERYGFGYPTLRLRISDLRVFTDPERVRPLTVGEMAVGAACPDDPEAICVPLG